MNNIEYDCYIKGVFCNPKCNDKKVYLVSNNLARRAEADYLADMCRISGEIDLYKLKLSEAEILGEKCDIKNS